MSPNPQEYRGVCQSIGRVASYGRVAQLAEQWTLNPLTSLFFVQRYPTLRLFPLKLIHKTGHRTGHQPSLPLFDESCFTPRGCVGFVVVIYQPADDEGHGGQRRALEAAQDHPCRSLSDLMCRSANLSA